jgi:hypothetical protein
MFIYLLSVGPDESIKGRSSMESVAHRENKIRYGIRVRRYCTLKFFWPMFHQIL